MVMTMGNENGRKRRESKKKMVGERIVSPWDHNESAKSNGFNENEGNESNEGNCNCLTYFDCWVTPNF